MAYLPGIVKFLGYTPWSTACRILPERIIKQRERLGLSQKRLAHKVGVSSDTIADWEKGQTKPSPWLLRILAACFAHGGRPINSVRTSKPDRASLSKRMRQSLAHHLKMRRRELGLSQAQAAERMGTTVWAIRGWEQGKYTPKPPHLHSIMQFLKYVPEDIGVLRKEHRTEYVQHNRYSP